MTNEAFPQNLDQEQFKDYLRRSYKAGSLDTLYETSQGLKELLASDKVPTEHKVGFAMAIEIIDATALEVEFHLKGENTTIEKGTIK